MINTTTAQSEQTCQDTAQADTALRIGNRVLPSRYFLSPLAGYTHLAFRLVIRELGGLGLATTDLVQATQLLAGSRKSRELILTCEADQPLSVQIFSGNTEELVKAAQQLEAEGYQGVDLNMGCPMAKVNSNGGGARLMCNTENAIRTVAAVVAAVEIPVTVKMRLGWDAEHITAPQLAAAFEQVGVAAITLHGRTRAQGFHGTVSHAGIAETVAAVKAIPVIGNGDVRTVQDAIAMRRVTGCAAVAIGRGAMLDPWIFYKLSRHGQSQSADTANQYEPSAKDQIDFLVRHFELMCEQHEDYSCVLFRKFAAWYGVRLGIPEDLENRLRQFESIAEFHEIVAKIRQRHGTRISAIPTALIKVPNGPVERW